MAAVAGLVGNLWDIARHPYAGFVLRMGVGTTFLIAAIAKIQQGSAFVDEVVEYDLLPEALARAFATVLPWIEMAVACLLIVGLATRYAAVVAILISLSLVIANSFVLARGLNLECGCFGDMAAIETRQAIIIDCVLLVTSFLILLRRGDVLSADLWLRRRRLRRPPDK